MASLKTKIFHVRREYGQQDGKQLAATPAGRAFHGKGLIPLQVVED